MIPSAFGEVSELPPAVAADYHLDFSSGNLPPEVSGPDADIVGPRTYCDQDRMYVALRGQPRIGFDHDALRWGLRRDVGSENLIQWSQPARNLPAPSAWNGSGNGLRATAFDAADFLLPPERCAMMDYKAESSTYIYPSGSSTSTAYTAGTRYTASMFFKNLDPGGVDIRLRLHPFAFGEYQDAIFVASTGAVVGGAANVADTIVGVESYPDGWKRLYITATATITASTYPPLLWPGGSATGRFLFGGFQLEALGFPTSYIPTSGARVVRGNERGITAAFPTQFFSSEPAASGYSLWADYSVKSLFLTAAVGIFGTNRASSTGDPYISIAVTAEGAIPALIIRTYYTATPTSTGVTRTNGRVFPGAPRNVHCVTWRDSPLALRECNLSAYADAAPVTAFPTFGGFAAGLTTPSVLLGSMMNPSTYILTGWIYECRMIRRFSTDDQLKEMVGV